MDIIQYESPVQTQSSITVPSALSGTETDLFKIVDQRYLHKSQFTVFASVTLGAVTSATFYYYITPNGTNWYPISLYNTTTGEITQRSVVIDSGTYALSSVSYFADNVPLGACLGFKITGKSSSGTPAYTISIISRDN